MHTRAIISAALTLVIWSAAAHAEANVVDTLRQYDAANAQNREKWELALGGNENGISWVNTYLRSVRKEAPLFCPPSDKVTTPKDVIQLLRELVRDKPNLGTAPFGLGVLLALQHKYPCDQGAAQPPRKGDGHSP